TKISPNQACSADSESPTELSGAPSAESSLLEASLDQLANRVREARRRLRQTGGALLYQAMSIGDILDEAQTRIDVPNWKKWLQHNCSLSVASALVYQRLARRRGEVEKIIAETGDVLSIRAALRLTAKPRAPSEPEPDITEVEKKKREAEEKKR